MSNTRLRGVLEFARRLTGALRRSRSDADLEEELRLHVELATEDAQRRVEPASDAARAARLRAGGTAQAMDALRDQRSLPVLDALTADLVFGWRQIVRHRTASVSAVLSLGLALGATMAGLRLVDAVLLRPLPVADPSRLFVVTRTVPGADNRLDYRDDADYPTYRTYVAAAGERAEPMVVGMAITQPIEVGSDDPETAVQQFVSGNVFRTLGLQPALGRLFAESDDVVPDGHPIAVISHDYWQRRFAGDPAVVGRTFRVGSRVIEIVGVAPRGFTGTEPGAVTDIFLPSMMNAIALERHGWTWFRIWIRPKRGVEPEHVQALLQARFHADQVERAKSFAPDTPKSRIDAYLNQQVVLLPAGAGVSGVQKLFRRPLYILAALAALLLLIACANVANLLLARVMSRRSEMALRLSIGAGRGRLIQLMLVESALLALLASAVAALSASWAAPFVVSMLSPLERPIRLILDLDGRTFAAGTALTFIVTMLFGLVPALRGSAVTPFDALKDVLGQRRQRRLTEALVAAQMAFCVFLLLGAQLFVGTFERLQDRPLGFARENLFVLEAETRASRTLPSEIWAQLAAALGETARIESAAVASWAPLSGNRWRSSITITGRSPEPTAPDWVSVSPGYFETMRTRMLRGREFRAGDIGPRRDDSGRPLPGVAIVNETFARVYFDGRNPIGERVVEQYSSSPLEIVGMVADAVNSFSVRDPTRPAVFVPLEPRYGGTLLVRTADGAADLPALLRREVSRIRPDVQILSAVPFDAIVTQQMIRERLLAALSTFFAGLALALAMIGMYGVLNYAVTRERREIGLRMALGARAWNVFRLVTTRLLAVTCLGALVGVAGGLAFGRAVRALLFQIEPTDPAALVAPILALAGAGVLAALPPVLRAVRIDPANALRNEG